MAVGLDLSAKEFGPGKVDLLIFGIPKELFCDTAFLIPVIFFSEKKKRLSVFCVGLGAKYYIVDGEHCNHCKLKSKTLRNQIL
jgi:hypothetical protein